MASPLIIRGFLPYLFEINTWPWLAAISKTREPPLILDRCRIATGMKSPISDSTACG
jgi:hypothetical protein